MRLIQVIISSFLVASALTLAPVGASAANDNREVVRNAGGSILHSSYGNCVRTQWSISGDPCAPAQPAQVTTLPMRAPISARSLEQDARTVYFGFNRATLDADATTRLDHMAQVIKSDTEVRQARIIGYADRMGSAGYNEKLSQRRAENVKHYLTGRGVITADTTETRWLGESAPITQCPANLPRKSLIECLQKDRRVEVEIDYYRDGQAH